MKMEDDREGVRAGKNLENLAEGLPLAAHPGYHDAGAQNAAEQPGQLIPYQEVVNHLRHGVICKVAGETGEYQSKNDFCSLFSGDEGQPADAVFISASSMADKVAGAHDGGKLGEENEKHGERAAADGVVGKALIGLPLYPPGDYQEDAAHHSGENPEQGAHAEAAHTIPLSHTYHRI